MVLERDYPMTRTQGRILVIGFAIMIAAGIVLFGGLIPGVKPNFAPPSTASIEGHEYDTALTPLHVPVTTNSTGPWNVSYHRVVFELWLSDWYSFTGGIVHGSGVEANGTSYPFELGQTSANGSRVQLYISPDWVFGVAWVGGIFGGFNARLFVEQNYTATP